ncbi:MAG: endolytic transglycosylase MltG [bacterium]
MSRPMIISLLWVVGPPLLCGLLLALWGRRRQDLSMTLLLFTGLVAAGLASTASARLFWGPPPPELPRPATVIVEPGASPARVAGRLEEEGVLGRARDLTLASRLTLSDRHIKSGRYRFPGGEGVLTVLERLTRGSTSGEMVTIPEGLRAPTVAGIAARQAEVDSAAFMRWVHDEDFIREVLPPVEGESYPESLEGYLLPETYNIYFQMPASEAVRLMVEHFNEVWRSELRERARQMGMTRHEVVTLASVIEREAATAAERPIISAVFHNRMERGMRLESCATVLYALGRYKPRLYEKDLQVQHPYNTYRNRGLPPGPIAAPGASSLRAAVDPADTDHLYFVARGDGTHIFSRTFDQHVRAKMGDGVPVGGRAAQEEGTGGGSGGGGG